MAKMLFSIFACAALFDKVLAQMESLAEISAGSSIASNAIPSSVPYQNPFTIYLTMTNSWGVVTGMPSVVTSQPAVITTQPIVATIPAGLETSIALGAASLPSGMTTVASIAEPSDQAQTIASRPSSSSDFDQSSSTRAAPAQQSTGAAPRTTSGSALLGAAALIVLAL